VWVDAPDVPLGAWEFYTVLSDDAGQTEEECTSGSCCAGTSSDAGRCCAETAQEA
jgi:hypothetical protein